MEIEDGVLREEEILRRRHQVREMLATVTASVTPAARRDPLGEPRRARDAPGYARGCGVRGAAALPG